MQKYFIPLVPVPNCTVPPQKQLLSSVLTYPFKLFSMLTNVYRYMIFVPIQKVSYFAHTVLYLMIVT